MAFLSAWCLRRRPSRLSRALAAALVAVLAFTETCVAKAEPTADGASLEYQVKAAMLYNFTRFISWPADAGQTVRVCVVGEDPFGAALAEFDGEAVDARVLVIEHVVLDDALDHCQIVFVGLGLGRAVPEILARLAERPVVTVGEGRDFVAQGGTIGLVLVDGKVRFDINVAGITQRGVRISSKLLRLARQVHSGETP